MKLPKDDISSYDNYEQYLNAIKDHFFNKDTSNKVTALSQTKQASFKKGGQKGSLIKMPSIRNINMVIEEDQNEEADSTFKAENEVFIKYRSEIKDKYLSSPCSDAQTMPASSLSKSPVVKSRKSQLLKK